MIKIKMKNKKENHVLLKCGPTEPSFLQPSSKSRSKEQAASAREGKRQKGRSAGCVVNFYWGLWVKSWVTCNVCSTSRARLENVDILCGKERQLVVEIMVVSRLGNEMVDISMVRYDNVDTLWRWVRM